MSNLDYLRYFQDNMNMFHRFGQISVSVLIVLCLLSMGVTAQAAVVRDISCTYSDGGMISGIADSKNSYNWTYQYDDANRLTGVRRGAGTTLGGGTEIDNKAYTYNNIGNITGFEGQAYTYTDAAHKHAVTAAGANAYTYDANGNMLAGADRAYIWNSENKPVSITKDEVETTFVYGPGGERVKKETGDNWKIYVGGIYEKDQTGAQTCYIDAAGVSVKKKADGSLFFILKDHLGGTAVITDAQGNVVTQQYYEPFGEDDSIGSVENEADDHKFTGQEEDTETGLYYYNARCYDPALGRFISADPKVGPNRYAYCGNNPVNVVDPSGFEPYFEIGTRANNEVYYFYNYDQSQGRQGGHAQGKWDMDSKNVDEVRAERWENVIHTYMQGEGIEGGAVSDIDFYNFGQHLTYSQRMDAINTDPYFKERYFAGMREDSYQNYRDERWWVFGSATIFGGPAGGAAAFYDTALNWDGNYGSLALEAVMTIVPLKTNPSFISYLEDFKDVPRLIRYSPGPSRNPFVDPPDKFYLGQPYVNLECIKYYMKELESGRFVAPIEAMITKGGNFIVWGEGNHRAAAAAFTGEDIWALVRETKAAWGFRWRDVELRVYKNDRQFHYQDEEAWDFAVDLD